MRKAMGNFNSISLSFSLPLFLFFLLSTGCSSPLLLAEPEIIGAGPEIERPVDTCCRSPYNKYLILVEGHNSTFHGDFISVDLLDANSQWTFDPYIRADLVQLRKLAFCRDYDIYRVRSSFELELLLRTIRLYADNNTKLMIGMSGEGGPSGFILNLVHVNQSTLIPPGKMVGATDLIHELSSIKGTKAIIVNACQSGCFVAAAKKDPLFRGVVIAACDVGYATTQCEHTGTSALFAGFLGLYETGFFRNIDLFKATFSEGYWLENIRHHLSDIGSGGLPINYDPIIYATDRFEF